MTRFQVWRYQCDFCGKRNLSGGHMKRHEIGCTANPARVCRFHQNFDKPQLPMQELVAVIDSRLPDHGMAKLREVTDNCPMCILAAIRISGVCKWDGDPESRPPDLGFNFKEELRKAWQTINDAKVPERGYDY